MFALPTELLALPFANVKLIIFSAVYSNVVVTTVRMATLNVF